MSFSYFGDIAFSVKSGTAFAAAPAIADDTRPAVEPVIQPTTGTPWSYWGSNNMMPGDIADDIANCGVLAAGLDAKARIGTGKGMQPFLLWNIDQDGKEILEWVSDTEIHDWLELNESFEFGYDSSFDKHAYGWNCGSYLLNLGKDKINRVIRHDVYEARLEKQNPKTGLIDNLYLSGDWKQAGTSFDDTKQIKINLLEEGNELESLKANVKSGGNTTQFAFCNRTLRNGAHFYPIPTYRSGKAWIKIARSVPSFKNAMFKNQITLKYMVLVHPKYWEDRFGQVNWSKLTIEERLAKQEDFYTKLDAWLSGEDNSYKSLFTGGFIDQVSGKFVPYVEVTVLDNKAKDGEHLPDSGAANSEILFALMINPALMGAGNPGGNAYGDSSGGSNVRESFLVQIMIMEAERRLNASVFNPVKAFNGWQKRLEIEQTIVGQFGPNTAQSRIVKPRLVFRYPTGLLTTLDTGKSTKTETA
jgi:hypothetical protein